MMQSPIGKDRPYGLVFLALVLITVMNVLIAATYSLIGIFSPQTILPLGGETPVPFSLFAEYAAARAIPLLIVVVVTVFRRDAAALVVLGTLAALVQLADALIGLSHQDLGKAVGPFLIAFLQVTSISVWRRSQQRCSSDRRV